MPAKGREEFSNFKFYQALSPDSEAAATAGETIDTQGYETCTFMVNLDDFSQCSTTSAWFIRMQHAHGSLGEGVDCSGPDSTWSNCYASEMVFTHSLELDSGGFNWADTTTSTGSGIDNGVCIHFAMSNASEASMWSRVYPAGYIGTRRFVRLYLSQSTVGDVSEIILAATCMLGNPGQWAVNVLDRT